MPNPIAAAFTAAAAAQGDLPVTAGMARWNESGRPITVDALARVHQVMLKDIGGRSDGSGRIRPSSIGHPCQRHMLLSFLGAEQREDDYDSQNIPDAGTWGHYRWQTWGLSHGWLSDIEVRVEDKSWLLEGAMDGIIAKDGSIFELKTINSYGYDAVIKAGEPQWPHRLQVGAYCKALGIDRASIVYEDRNFPARWHEFRFILSENADIEFALRLLKRDLRGHIKSRELPEMLTECREQKGKIFEQCKFNESCPMARWPK